MTTAKVELPPKLIPVFSGPARYRGAHGGRGSAKTRSFALMTAVKAYQAAAEGRSGVILCGREFVNSLDDSSLPEIKAAIEATDWLAPWFDIGEKFVRTKGLPGRIDYRFAGLRHNVGSLKSKARIIVAWIDEAEDVSETAWRKLIPTVREDGSEIWVTWNPEKPDSPTHNRFIKAPPDNSKIVQINYTDNPWFPDVLDEERLNDLARLDPNTYAHIWEGAHLINSDAQVFAGKWRVDDFEINPSWDGPYQGGDFGFSQDPTAAVRCYIDGDRLYVSHEAFAKQLALDGTAAFVEEKIPGYAEYVSRWDSASPGSIELISRHGMPRATATDKWQGSIEDGIRYLRSFREIVVHTRCKGIKDEMRLYSYKVDRLSGDILPTIVDAHNHGIDALRYAVSPMIRQGFHYGMLGVVE
ncbi:PBSX family phage terminase large subunit [Fulvimarina sp. 2208YS6-2-32]|uniref:PBSX family phage terminase large subunit n=1 Tax=Fulvimarina uroteuthidis TaxID=3098149 RepID=A0ABU5HYT1_9HYPH|nr:PBSX family phage terminase large subunit [Fulvimarina sp. 2208YS6-2-32]MDY8108269.1 PBSX family phage terminase large subunit [Fulvimarina sp. 2208YS6-2-32]